MDERFTVLETGKCSLKCECELIELGPNKEKVCPMTWEPCGHTHLKDFANG